MFPHSSILLKVEEKSQSKDITLDDQDSVLLGEYIEILSTDDERLSIIGEELSNETGRKILKNIFEGKTTVSSISSNLGISIQLVSWHIERLSKIGLIRISSTGLSQKNKKVNHYEPAKLAIVIVPSSITSSPEYSNILKSSLKKIYGKLAVFTSFIVGSTLLYLQHNLNTPTPPIELNDPDYVKHVITSNDITTSIIGGFGMSLATWLSIKIYIKWKNIHR